MGHLQSGGGDRRGAGAKSSREALDAAECQLLPSAYDTTTVAVIAAASVRESLGAECADDCSDGGVHDVHGGVAGGVAAGTTSAGTAPPTATAPTARTTTGSHPFLRVPPTGVACRM